MQIYSAVCFRHADGSAELCNPGVYKTEREAVHVLLKIFIERGWVCLEEEESLEDRDDGTNQMIMDVLRANRATIWPVDEDDVVGYNPTAAYFHLSMVVLNKDQLHDLCVMWNDTFYGDGWDFQINQFNITN